MKHCKDNFLPKIGCGGRLITTIPVSVALPGFPATPMVCIGGLKSCHWYVLLYSEFSCKDKNGFGSVSIGSDVSIPRPKWLSSSCKVRGTRLGFNEAECGEATCTFSRTDQRPYKQDDHCVLRTMYLYYMSLYYLDMVIFIRWHQLIVLSLWFEY